MKKLLFLLFFVLIIFAVSKETMAQDTLRHSYSIGLKGGVGMNINGYRLEPDAKGFTYYSVDPLYTFGIDIGLFVSKKIRTRMELNYVQMDYGMNWNYENSNFDKTTTILYDLNAKIQFDYLLYSKKKLSIFVSPAIVGEIVAYQKYRNEYTDGSTAEKKYNVIDEQFPDKIVGLEASTIIKYNISKAIGITFTPSYDYFLRNFVLANDKPYQRFDFRFGMEYTF